LVFILLDAGRADRFGAWGNAHPTSPHLDALARSGARFARHYANAHATRASLPQIMSGRYYHPNILAPFKPNSHPREYPFREPDPTAVLLTNLLRERGYHLIGVSAHPWVVDNSEFGRAFHRLDFLPAAPERGHVDARAVVDRALSLWEMRPRDRPTFLYVHFMDLHMPRWLPSGELRFANPSLPWRDRFSEGSKPLFGEEVRGWDADDARDFTTADLAIFTAFYDTLVAYTDAEIGRLLAAMRAEDPELGSVLVAVLADHGEELGEEGRTSHPASLSEAVHHIPFILAGGGVRSDQRFDALSANIDVTPTILSILGLTAPTTSTFDGRSLLTPDGSVCGSCGRSAVHYAWVTYKGIRKHRHLLQLAPQGTAEAACPGRSQVLWQLRNGGREEVPIAGPAAARAARLRRRIARRLDRKEASFLRLLRSPKAPFSVPAAYWRVTDDSPPLACREVSWATERAALAVGGWIYARESFVVMREGNGTPLGVTVAVPDGTYLVEAAGIPMDRQPLLFGFERWLRKSFRPNEPTRFTPLGTFEANGQELTLYIPQALGLRQRLVALRMTPPSVEPVTGGAEEDRLGEEQRERLRILGYIE
jgi:arylsulfatase A-like enzyme